MATEVLLLAALTAGFFGSVHCFGMCGAVVTLLEQPRLPVGVLRRRLACNVGRLGFYVLLGVIAGGAGFALTRVTGVEAGLQLLRALAGLLVILLALQLLFDLRALRFIEAAGVFLWRRLAPFRRQVLPVTTLPRALGAGFVWGALPCGLVYSSVAMAAASGSVASGAMVMLAFWAGTLPALLAAGALAAGVERLSRRPALRRAGGIVLLAVGALGIALPFVHGGGQNTHHDAATELPRVVLENGVESAVETGDRE